MLNRTQGMAAMWCLMIFTAGFATATHVAHLNTEHQSWWKLVFKEVFEA